MAISDYTSKLKDIDLSDLQLDTENYRIGPQVGQHEAIQAIIEEQGQKLVELADDFLDIGLSPIELITVCPSDDGSKFRVVEGNRRVTMLKLLREPALATNTPLEKKFHTLAASHGTKVPKSLTCMVLPTKQAAFVWIQRKHDTGLGGAATIPWSAIAIRRAKEALGNRQVTLEVMDLVAQQPSITEADLKTLAKMPVTNLERILDDPAALKMLGLEVRGAELVCQFDQTWTVGVLTDIVKDIAYKKIKVRDIYDDKKRAKYVADVSKRQKKAPTTTAEWAVKRGGKIDTPAPAKKRVKLVPTVRLTLIPITCRLRIGHPRINAIYNELRRKLKTEALPNCAAAMLRVFVELSVDHYMQKKAITLPSNVKVTLYNKLKVVADYMETQGIMSRGALKPVRLAATSPHEILSTETLNAYVHSPHVMPKPADLRDSWDAIEPFVTAIWN